MKVPVYFAPVREKESPDLIEKKILALYDEAGFDHCITQNDIVAIKMHFGEKGNVTHISPRYVRPIVTKIKQGGGIPFLTDTNVLYRSERSHAITHLQVAHSHGFTLENTGAPVIIADGLIGSNETEVKIPGQIYSEVSLATEAVMANALMVLSHVTGHMATGLGATLKNLGMGLASRKGKLRQHSGMRPRIDAYRCTGCELCLKWCPERAISMKAQVAAIT
ncbi:MAG: DUF362 domain-containing protein, partial [candidate division KSB1 bacterium]|nr:DUF362 domain-containing protein [candidate division KSB1 bacterium]